MTMDPEREIETRELSEALMTAKNALLEALREAERLNKPAICKAIDRLCAKTESLQNRIA